MTDLVRFDVAAGVATITLDSPHNRNALSRRLRDELTDALHRADDDATVRVIVLTHTGSVFCSGADLTEVVEPGSLDANSYPQILESMWHSRTPIVGALHGAARAGGIGLVASCDIVIASTATTFAFSEVRLGVVPAVISVPVLPRLAPRAASELFLTGGVFDAARAVDVGLITRAVEPDDVHDAVADMVGQLALGAPNALAATKALLTSAVASSMTEQLADMNALSARHFGSDEAAEGIAAFRAKRPAAWVPTKAESL